MGKPRAKPRAGRPRKISEEDAKHIRRMYRSGYSLGALAVLYSVTPQAIGIYTRGLVPAHRQSNKLREDDLLIAAHWYRCGRSLADIAKDLKVSRQAVHYHMQQRQVRKRRQP